MAASNRKNPLEAIQELTEGKGTWGLARKRWQRLFCAMTFQAFRAIQQFFLDAVCMPHSKWIAPSTFNRQRISTLGDVHIHAGVWPCWVVRSEITTSLVDWIFGYQSKPIIMVYPVQLPKVDARRARWNVGQQSPQQSRIWIQHLSDLNGLFNGYVFPLFLLK